MTLVVIDDLVEKRLADAVEVYAFADGGPS